MSSKLAAVRSSVLLEIEIPNAFGEESRSQWEGSLRRTHASTLAVGVLLAAFAAGCSTLPSVDEFGSLENEGLQLLTEGSYSEAAEIFSALIDSYPSDDHDALAVAYFNRSIAYFQQGRIEDALADETAAIELDPSDIDLLATLHLNRSREYIYLDQADDAIAAATAAIELEPSDTRTLARAYMNRGTVLSRLGRVDEAVADFDAAVDVSAVASDRTHARVSRAEALVQLERSKEAIEDATLAIDALSVEGPQQRDGSRFTTSELLGRAYLVRGAATFLRTAEAGDLAQTAEQIEADLTHAIELIGDSDPARLASAYYFRGSFHYFRLDDVAARSDLERALELLPSTDPRSQFAADLLAEIVT